MRTDEMAAPGMEDRSVRRRELPDRVAEARLERFDRELGTDGADDFLGDLRSGDDEQLDFLLRWGIIHCYPTLMVPCVHLDAGVPIAC